MGTTTSKIAWLHLSDLHVGHPTRKWDARQAVGTLQQGIQDAVKIAKVAPTFLFFTGDLGFGELKNATGKRISDQLKRGVELLDDLRRCVTPAIARENVFLVPGNHDLNRSLITKADREWLRDPRRTLSEMQDLLLKRSQDWRSISERQKAFREIMAKRFGNLDADKATAIYAVKRRIGAHSIGIAGFNSAWSCGEDNEKGKLWMGGAFQAELLLEKLQGVDFRIALIHHPGNWFTEADELDFWRSRIQGQFDVCLHGHEHTAWVHALQTGHVTIAAGATYEESHRPTGFNLTVVNIQNRSGFVHLRTYNPKGRGWNEEIIQGLTDGEGNWPLEQVGLRNRTRESIAALVKDVHNPRRLVTPSSNRRIRKAKPADFEDVLKQLGDIRNGKGTIVSLATNIGIALGIASDTAFVESIRLLTGISAVPGRKNQRIAIVGPRLGNTELAYVGRGIDQDAEPIQSDAYDSIVTTIKSLCPSVTLRNYVIMSKGATDTVALVEALNSIVQDASCRVVVISLKSAGRSEILADMAQYLLDKEGIVLVVPPEFNGSRKSEADDVTCRVVSEGEGPVERHGGLVFPGDSRTALGVAAAFLASTIATLDASGIEHSGRAVLRAVRQESEDRTATEPPLVPRAVEYRLRTRGAEA